MPAINSYNLLQTYNKDYLTWNENKNLQNAKRQEYFRRNPDAIKDYDLQRANILLSAVDMMDKSIVEKSDKMNVVFESATSVGLGYAAVGGTALGFLITKLKVIKNAIDKIVQKHPKSKNIVSMGITSISGVLGILAAYPIYNYLSNIESKIHRKRKFETMEKELQDPKIFVVLDSEQKKVFKQNLNNLEQKELDNNPAKILKKNIKTIKQLSQETLNYEEEQAEFRKRYEEDKALYEKTLSEKEIKNAKKDRELLTSLVKNINGKSQTYTEKMTQITDNLVTLSFAMGSLFTLGYERLAKRLNFKSSSLPAGMGVLLMVASTFFATWAQKRAAHVGRFKAKQELMQNPEQMIYLSHNKTESIDDNDIKKEKIRRTNSFEFLKEFFKNNKEYEKWKESKNYSGKNISKAMENIDITSEQLQDGKRLQKNMFKTFYKVDKNTQNYSSDIDVVSESVKFPITLVLGSLGSVWGMKHLAQLRSATVPKEIFKHSAKYIGTISLFTIPSLIINSYFAKAQKMGARISDMATMQDLEDYRYFADYSKFDDKEITRITPLAQNI